MAVLFHTQPWAESQLEKVEVRVSIRYINDFESKCFNVEKWNTAVRRRSSHKSQVFVQLHDAAH